MKSNQSGFSVVEIIMAIVIVGLVGAVGWLYWQNSSGKDSPQDDAAASSKQATSSKTVSSNNQVYTNSKYGFSFEYPKQWTVGSNKEITGDDDGLLIKSPAFKLVNVGQDSDYSGNYINISTIDAWNASIAEWESQQSIADPDGTWGHFTFAGKPAVIFRSESQYNGKNPPVPSISDMYKGEDTWVQGKSIIYSFWGSTGVDFYYSDKSLTEKIKGDGNQKDLYDTIKIVLDSWKWL